MTDPQIQDFSLPMAPKRFRLDPDTFEAPAIMSAMTMRRIATLYSGMPALDGVQGIDTTLAQVTEMFGILLPGESGERFVARLNTAGGPDDPPPIDLSRQALPVMQWLMEQYGMRPTQPSSASSDGSTDGTPTTPNDGTGSTAGATPTD